TTAMDFSGNENNGTLQSDATWAPGQFGKAIELDGVDDFVEVPTSASLVATDEVTVMAWINTPRSGGPGTEAWQGIVAKGNAPRSYSFYTYNSGDVLHFSVGPSAAYIGSTSSAQVPLDEWAHVCAMVIDGHHQYYINGEDAGTGGTGTVLPGDEDTANVVIGRSQEGAGRSFLGRIDDVRIYMRGLTQEEVQEAMSGAGVPQAFGPNPANGAMHKDTWVTLSWNAGDFAASHDVYLGEDRDEVENAIPESEVFRGNQGSTYYVAGFPGYAYPEGLVPGTTYYWRIDEVNDLNPDSPWKGDVWSFTVPPRKAYAPDPADGAGSVALDARLSWTPGLGAKLHTVYFGDDLDTVANATAGVPTGPANYNPGPLKAAKLYYWRVDEFDGAATYKGDVWSFSTEGGISNPYPADGAVDVTQTPILSWTPAVPAASHEIYLGTDAEAVRNATEASPEFTGSMTRGDYSYDPGLEYVLLLARR
ncbi:MAG: LamG domain-containing protein, partial [Sedimentisphaerales bacterium]